MHKVLAALLRSPLCEACATEQPLSDAWALSRSWDGVHGPGHLLRMRHADRGRAYSCQPGQEQGGSAAREP